MATPSMSMNRIIHSAVRRDVARTERALRDAPAGDTQRLQEVQRGWNHLVVQLTHHHEQEDALIWPYLRGEGVDASLLDAMESEHQAMSRALADGTAAVEHAVTGQVPAATAADVVANAGRVINDHLAHEERDIEPQLAQRHDDPAWKAIEKRFREGGLVRAGTMMAWLQDGGDEEAQTALTATIPPPVLFVLSHGFGRGYHKNVAPVWR